MTSQDQVSSRLAKKQQKKLAQQTALIITITLVLTLGFLFLVLPNIVRIAFNVLDEDLITNSDDSIPPQVPILDSPLEATNSGAIKVSGFGEVDSKIVLILNGEEKDQTKVDQDGKFDFEVELSPGENSITTFAVDGAENESSVSKKYLIILDSEAPTITIESPERNSTITLRKNQITTIKGTTEANAKVYIAGKLAFANSDGEFSGTYSLSEGENKIEIKAIDQAGNETITELILNFAY